MVGIRGVLIVALMAEIASGGSAGVLSVGMTLRAGGIHMSARQRITRLGVMVEARRRPSIGIVANRANEAERRRRVNRIVGIVEIGLMTVIAACRRAAVHAISVAERAGGGYVGSGQRIAGLRVMIEARRRPSSRAMTNCAGVAERRRRVNRVVRVIEIGLMAAVAVCRRTAVHAVGMAESAGCGCMSPGQRIAGLRAMIKARGRPGGRIVAFRADEAEGRRRVDGIGRAAEIVMMAGVAS